MIPRIVGHRGSPHDAPENTLASFQAALAAGARGVELDVRLSADDVVVVHHDAQLGRILEGSERIEDMRAAELHARGVPFLSQLLPLPLWFDVEIKGDADNASQLPAHVHETVRAAGAQERVLVTSFDHELADQYARLSGSPAGMIVPYAPEPRDVESYPRLRTVAIAEDAALPETIASLRAQGRDVLVWTVNDGKSALALLRAGADGIITDRPGPMMRALELA
ncbi:MAG TPA: glycerophosphodiester phosphodiesterase [Candidatus Thermoplasmatota archaeon]|nr:glycerophosphodiester phosphodiesterase [Candidatus Thermoplasmatota archaeon]